MMPSYMFPQNFFVNLLTHVRGRQLGRSLEGDPDLESEIGNAIIVNEKMRPVLTLRKYYVSYDLQRDYDVINPRTKPFVMILDPEAVDSRDLPHGNPYYYAQVINIFRVDTLDCTAPDAEPERMDILFVRWITLDTTYRGGWDTRRLHRVAFVPGGDPYSQPFGFLDPRDVVRAAHLIPAFASGRAEPGEYMGKSGIRPAGEDRDWKYFYANP